jgi:hypothetical protein
MRYVKIVILLMFFIVPVIVPSPVLAIDPPSSTPVVSNVHGFGGLVEIGDVLIYGEYNIPYTDLPDVPANFTYIFQLLDESGNEVGAVLPFAYFDYGYNLGVFGFYFSASSSVTFGEVYSIRISQNPAYFESPEVFDNLLADSIWSTAETQDDMRNELAVAVISSAERLELEYTTEYNTVTLLQSGLLGTVLSSPLGEMYFRRSVYGIQAMAPSLFMYQVVPYDTGDRVYGDNLSANYTGRYEGTDIGEGVEATGVQFGMTGTAVMALAFALPVCLGFIIVSAKKFHKTEPGFLISALVVLMVYMMGWMPAAIFATIYQLCGIYVAYVWFYARG